MSTLGCKCGYVIRNTKYDLPYKGEIRPDQDEDYFYDTVTRELALLVEAVANGRREEWISRHFLPGYPSDGSNDGIISDFLSMLDRKLNISIYECENCGRLWVQEKPEGDTLVSYSPDSGSCNRVLASARYAVAKDEPTAS